MIPSAQSLIFADFQWPSTVVLLGRLLDRLLDRSEWTPKKKKGSAGEF